MEIIDVLLKNLDSEQTEALSKGGKVSSDGTFSYSYLDLGTGNHYKATGRVINNSVVMRESVYDTNCGAEEIYSESLTLKNVAGQNFKLYKSRISCGIYTPKDDIKIDAMKIDKLYDRFEEIIADINDGITYKELAHKYDVQVANTPARQLRKVRTK